MRGTGLRSTVKSPTMTAGSTAVRDAMKKLTFTTVFGKDVTFDDHNQAGKFVILQTVKNRKVTVADIVAVD